MSMISTSTSRTIAVNKAIRDGTFTASPSPGKISAAPPGKNRLHAWYSDLNVDDLHIHFAHDRREQSHPRWNIHRQPVSRKNIRRPTRQEPAPRLVFRSQCR